MTDNADLLARADSLIRSESIPVASDPQEQRQRLSRRRSFIAATLAATPQDPQQEPFAVDDDLPILTDVVVPPAATDETTAIAAGLRAVLADELADQIQRRMVAELPALVDDLVIRAGEALRERMQTTLAEAVDDYLAQRGQLRLPMTLPAGDEPDGTSAMETP